MRWIVLAMLVGCGSKSPTTPDLTATIRYNRVGCAPCEVTAPTTKAAFDATVRCYLGDGTHPCLISGSGDRRLIDCSQYCGVEWEGVSFYDACGWKPPTPATLTVRCPRG